MKKYKLIFSIVILFNTLLASEIKNDETINFGFLSSYNILDNFKDARKNLKNWLEKLGEDKNFSLNVIFYKDSSKLLDDYLNGKLDLVTMSYYLYHENQPTLDSLSSRLWTITYNKEQTYKLCLVKSNNLKFNSFKDLKGKSIILRQYDDTGSSWLNYESYKSNKKAFSEVLALVKYERNESTSLLNVYFNKHDLALVRKDTWDTMLELNPSISKKVSLFKCSDINFLPFISLFSNRINDDYINTFFKIAGDMRNQEKIRNIYELFQFDTIIELKKDDLKDIDKLYSDYFKLKNKYE